MNNSTLYYQKVARNIVENNEYDIFAATIGLVGGSLIRLSNAALSLVTEEERKRHITELYISLVKKGTKDAEN